MRRNIVGNKSGDLSVFATGLTVSVVVTMLCISIGAALISAELIGVKDIRYWVVGIHLISSVCGCLAVIGKGSGRTGLMAIATAITYLVGLLGITILLFGGHYKGVGSGVVAVAIGYLATLVVGNKRLGTSVNGKNKRRHR